MENKSLLDIPFEGPISGSSMTVSQQADGRYSVVEFANSPLSYASTERIKKEPWLYKNLDEEGIQFYQKTLQIETVVRRTPALDGVVKNYVNGSGKKKNVF